ncbi:uncharacterized protein K489DRAFT_383333 [Dissoconium aciculare CBS 342.82]|uniref:Zn(2)-C6 fungal-type domain-containing protein n=1 Tax=Dissoconium aciculare CBS 342.82 TaxID=1314786 RepID=A0A6J3LWT2_9PEZI|nr:uncharacterized protein K489DRAFT_383333 [Dissoconium aciculare CBS 342.82]KAF1819759.1 hypothetical protein K489DRAFT_383333 [Dissoconium aciculare CBS 342.82]
MESANDSLKRKRSPSDAGGALASASPAKISKPNHQLSINYLARHSQDDLPLVTKDDTLPNLLHLLSSYNNVLDRHESLASNLGARPLGPILIKRFERCFDAPPKIISSHVKPGAGAGAASEDASHQITWLEVIEFARAHPSQFTLTTFSEGSRVCQFYYPQKQTRVQVSEEDFLFINSGRCQELIPPLPIWEDEEKEFNTCDLLEVKLKELTNAADLVAARTRQLTHRLKGRRAAIAERRAEGGSGTPAKAGAPQATTTFPHPAAVGHHAQPGGNTRPYAAAVESGEGSSATVRDELLRHFESLPHNYHNPVPHSVAHSRQPSMAGHLDHGNHAPRAMEGMHSAHHEGISNASSLSPAPPNVSHADGHSRARQGHTSPSRSHQATASQSHRHSPTADKDATNNASGQSRHNFSRPLPAALESSQPYRPICQASMDSLPRGHRVIPPCDRCRRLRMDCLKNLTSCAGCTRKHARCHWREVSREELSALDHLMNGDLKELPNHADSAMPNGHANGDAHSDGHHEESEDDESNPLEDLEALGQIEEQDAERGEGSGKKDGSQSHPSAAAHSPSIAEQVDKSAADHRPPTDGGKHSPSNSRAQNNDSTTKPADNNLSHPSSHHHHNSDNHHNNNDSKSINSTAPASAAASSVKRPTYDPVHDNSPYTRPGQGGSNASASPPPHSQPPQAASAAASSGDVSSSQGGRSGFNAVNGSVPAAGAASWRAV